MEQTKKGLLHFLFTAYGLFWGIVVIVFVLIGTGALNVSLEGDNPFLSGIKILFSWTPTIAVLIHLKKLFPNTSVKGLINKLFHQPINWKLVLLIIGIQVLLNVVAGLFISAYDKVSFMSQWQFSFSVMINAALMSLLTGASGEECGWRGYLQPYFMEKKAVFTVVYWWGSSGVFGIFPFG